MKIYRYFSHNGVFFPEGENTLNARNRAFLYGDGFFETLHANGMEMQLFNFHWQRILDAFEILDLQMPVEFKNNPLALKEHLRKLLHKNRFFQGVRIRITFYRESPGLYYPTQNRTSYLIRLEKLESNKYVLNTLGLDIGICDDMTHPHLPWSGFKTLNSLIFIHAAKKIRELDFDDCLFIDSKGYLIEALASNIFVLEGKKLYTPPIDVGCVKGVMRRFILNSASQVGVEAKEKKIHKDFLAVADEVWLSNAISGIKWVLSYKERRYFNVVAKKMNLLINAELIAK